MASRQRVLLDKLGNRAVDVALKRFGKYDIETAERKGRNMGRLAFRLDRKHRERTFSNLAFAFPGWSAAEVERVGRGVFDHYGIVLGDFLRSPNRSAEEMLASTTVDGEEHYFAAEALGKGVVAVTGHFGNWERFGHYCHVRGRDVAVVARPANDTGLEARVLKLREQAGLNVISRGDSTREIIRVLRRGGLVGILSDQNASECFIPWFGRPTGAVLGPAVLHLRTGATLMSGYCARVGVGKYHVMITPPFNADHSERDATAITAIVNARLEEVIREFPEQWLWMHDRWKSARRKGLLA
jgi:Kdo2-lipid IVA lauroyltransferase/acyltransferase